MNKLSKAVIGVLATSAAVLSAIAASPAAQAAPNPIDLTSSSCASNIKQGASGGCVVELQSLLNQFGAKIATDGSFGPGTATAVKNFQRAYGLSVDGIVGPATKTALYTKPVSITSANCPANISSGARGGCVASLQTLLNTDNHAGLAVDGRFGAGTLAAVKTFQNARCLTADGIVGANTKSRLTSNNTACSPTGATTVYASNAALSAAQMKVNAQYIMTYLRAQGWSKNAVCGVLGNMQWESSINPGRWEGNNIHQTGGFGLAQWTPSSNYTGWANSHGYGVSIVVSGSYSAAAAQTLMKGQLAFLAAGQGGYYATSSYNLSFAQFKTSGSSPSYLAAAFLYNYERPASYSSLGTRETYATNWCAQL